MTTKRITSTCDDCGFTSSDTHLVLNHSCDVVAFGGRCEDYPCCGHESGDCNGLLYGSDEAIKAQVYLDADTDMRGFDYDEGDFY
jgi:hypothetical protein